MQLKLDDHDNVLAFDAWVMGCAGMVVRTVFTALVSVMFLAFQDYGAIQAGHL